MNNELEEIKKLAGISEYSPIQQQKKWADKQLTNKQIISDQLPATLNNFNISYIKHKELNNFKIDRELENLADRLNKSLGSDFTSNIKIERLL